MGASVTLPLTELDDIRNTVQTRDAKIAELEAALTAAEISDASGRIDLLVEALSTAMPIIAFAVANLDPTTVRGWPHKELSDFAARLPSLPGATPLQKEVAIELGAFAKECEFWWRKRLDPTFEPTALSAPNDDKAVD